MKPPHDMKAQQAAVEKVRLAVADKARLHAAHELELWERDIVDGALEEADANLLSAKADAIRAIIARTFQAGWAHAVETAWVDGHDTGVKRGVLLGLLIGLFLVVVTHGVRTYIGGGGL